MEGGVRSLEEVGLLVYWVQIGLPLRFWLVRAPSAQKEEVVPTSDQPHFIHPCQELMLPPFLTGYPKTIQRNILLSQKQFCKRNF